MLCVLVTSVVTQPISVNSGQTGNLQLSTAYDLTMSKYTALFLLVLQCHNSATHTLSATAIRQSSPTLLVTYGAI